LSRYEQNGKLRAVDKISTALDPMKNENFNPADEKLGALLRESRLSPSLPPRFQENVWRRIEDAEAPARSGESMAWLEALIALVLRPRFAYAALAALMLAGVSLGAYSGAQSARHEAEARYVASVAPNPLR
jgi:hypothetical protein